MAIKAPAQRQIRRTLTMPALHADQARAWNMQARFRAIRCGRRWGKTALGINAAATYSAHQKLVGWFAPEYKYIAEAYRDIDTVLTPIKTSATRDGVYNVAGGGRIDFWSLDNEDAGRSRKYHLVIIDEAAFTKDATMMGQWEKAIKPTLLDYGGQCLALSNTRGMNPENFFYKICNDPTYGFKELHAPTHNNPFLPPEEVAKLIKENDPLVYQQEYLAEFVDWSGAAFFGQDKLLVDGKPVPMPAKCDAVFAIVDTASKTKTENDGTAVTFYARSKFTGHPLVVLDWDIVQIEGALLETWMPTIFQRLESLAKACGARHGSIGAFIEDKNSGTVLIQQAVRRGWPAQAIDSKLTAMGKDERAISISGYHYQGLVKIAQPAFDKVTTYKKTSRNHFLGQVVGFRVGDKDGSRQDDLLDTYCYGVAIALGNREGF